MGSSSVSWGEGCDAGHKSWGQQGYIKARHAAKQV